MSEVTTTERRDWDWGRDGVLEGMYVETREVVVKNGPSAGKSKLVFDFHHGLDDELVSAWETAVLRSAFSRELKARGKPDFEPGERITITPTGRKKSASSGFEYPDFDVQFEFAAPKKSTAELLASHADEPEEPDVDDIPFG